MAEIPISALSFNEWRMLAAVHLMYLIIPPMNPEYILAYNEQENPHDFAGRLFDQIKTYMEDSND